MNLRHLEVFRLVMQVGTIKGAASLMHVSEAAVSKLLATAERRMGLQLFERAKGRLVPTPEATRLYEDVDQLWSRVERIEDLVSALANPLAGNLTVAISPSLGTTVVPRAITALLAQMPMVTVNVELLIPHLLVQALVEGTAELGVSVSPQEHPSLKIERRYACPLVCVMPEGHALSGKSVITPKDLAGHDVVSYPQALTYGITEQALYGSWRSKIRVSVNVRSGQTACWLSLAGAGAAIVDAATVAGGAFPQLVVKPYRSAASLSLLVLRHRNRPASRAATMFGELLHQTWQELEPV